MKIEIPAFWRLRGSHIPAFFIVLIFVLCWPALLRFQPTLKGWGQHPVHSWEYPRYLLAWVIWGTLNQVIRLYTWAYNLMEIEGEHGTQG